MSLARVIVIATSNDHQTDRQTDGWPAAACWPSSSYVDVHFLLTHSVLNAEQYFLK